MDILERFSKYIAFETTSSEESDTTPSTRCQLDLARYLVDELKKIGVEKVTLDRHGIVYGWITATAGYEDKKALGFITLDRVFPCSQRKKCEDQCDQRL